jgi:lysophospholipase L1-like esterase
LPPQIEAVNKDTRLVTVTIGGNDLGYVMNLYGGSCTPQISQASGRPCPALRAPKAEDYAKLESNLRLIAQEVHKRAPRARLVFVQYVKLIADAPCEALGQTPEGMLINREIGERLAMVTARAAAAEGAEVLASDELSRRHTLCDAQPWSVGSKPTGPDGPAMWHPNAAGHAALADALVKMLRR